MSVDIEKIVLGPLETNCYVLRCDGQCWIVDPGIWPVPLMEHLEREKLTPERVLLTHGHGDHIDGLTEIKKTYPDAIVCCPKADEEMLSDPWKNLSAMVAMPIEVPPADELIEPGRTLGMGDCDWQVLDTSGHSPGGVSYYCRQEGVVFTGDALFCGSIGRHDIPGADEATLLGNIRRNLLSLPDETKVLPGHGPETTIGDEKRTNPFVMDDPKRIDRRRAEIDRNLNGP